MSKYTPGPWHIAGAEKVWVYSHHRPNACPDGQVIACTARTALDVPLEELEANAAHIVKCVNAHDDMLEALKLAYDSACTNQDSTPSKEAFLKMRAAIAKAEGK